VADKSANIADAPALRLQEGIMTGPDFRLSINRRRLLTSGAAAATAAIAPGAGCVKAAFANAAQPATLPAETPALKLCAATARRLLEIARRNEIRREAKLPLLPIAKELRRIKREEDLEKFSRFEAVHGKAVWEQVLKARREAEGNPNWRPSWMECMCLQNQVHKALWEQLYNLASGDPAVPVAIPKPVPLSIDYPASDSRVSAFGSGFVRYVHHFVNRHKFRGNLPQSSDSQS
jgi:hypothetical protein